MRAGIALLVAALMATHSVHAREHVALAGTEFSGLGSYTYLGIISPLGDAHLGNGFVMRHWLERLTYQYDSAGAKIDAERYGYAPSVGYQTPLGRGYAGLYAGLRFADTELSPDDPSNGEEGRTNRVFLQADATTPIGARAENQLVANFETRYSDYYVRDRLLLRLGKQFSFGPEVVFKGGRDYEGWQAGLAFGGIKLRDNLGLLLRGGISAQDGESNTGYASLELVMDL